MDCDLKYVAAAMIVVGAGKVIFDFIRKKYKEYKHKKLLSKQDEIPEIVSLDKKVYSQTEYELITREILRRVFLKVCNKRRKPYYTRLMFRTSTYQAGLIGKNGFSQLVKLLPQQIQGLDVDIKALHIPAEYSLYYDPERIVVITCRARDENVVRKLRKALNAAPAPSLNSGIKVINRIFMRK